jgi:uncharacterized protein YjhX (UPF0386 family)
MRRHNEDFFFFKEEVKRKRILKDENKKVQSVSCLTVPSGFGKVQCEIQVSNGPKTTISKI